MPLLLCTMLLLSLWASVQTSPPERFIWLYSTVFPSLMFFCRVLYFVITLNALYYYSVFIWPYRPNPMLTRFWTVWVQGLYFIYCCIHLAWISLLVSSAENRAFGIPPPQSPLQYCTFCLESKILEDCYNLLRDNRWGARHVRNLVLLGQNWVIQNKLAALTTRLAE